MQTKNTYIKRWNHKKDKTRHHGWICNKTSCKKTNHFLKGMRFIPFYTRVQNDQIYYVFLSSFQPKCISCLKQVIKGAPKHDSSGDGFAQTLLCVLLWVGSVCVIRYDLHSLEHTSMRKQNASWEIASCWRLCLGDAFPC